MNKFFKSLGVIIGINLTSASVNKLYNSTLFSFIPREFIHLLNFSKIPVVSAVVIDKLVHQDLTNNKAIQYIATTVETIEIINCMAKLVNHSYFLADLFSLDLSNNNSFIAKNLAISIIAQAFALKYIWDVEESTELELLESLTDEITTLESFE